MYVKPNHKEIRTLMIQKGLNACDVARGSGCQLSQPTISRLASGKTKKAQSAKIEALAKVLYVPVETLLKQE